MSPSVSNEEHSMMSCVFASSSMAWEKKKPESRTLIHDHQRSDLSIKDKNEDVDDIVFQMIRKSVVLQLNVVFLI